MCVDRTRVVLKTGLFEMEGRVFVRVLGASHLVFKIALMVVI